MANFGQNLISEQEIYDYLMTKPGMTENKALGIMANIKAESKFYADAKQPNVDNPGLGLFQHTYPARKDAFLEAVPDWETNWKGQIDFAMQEQEMQNYMNHEPFDSPTDSTRYFMLNFERPYDQSEEAIQGRIANVDTLNINVVQPIEITETETEVDKVYVIDYDSGEPIKDENDNFISAQSTEGQNLIDNGTGYLETKSQYEARQQADPGIVEKKSDYKKDKLPGESKFQFNIRIRKEKQAEERKKAKAVKAAKAKADAEKEKIKPEDIVTDEEEEIKEKETIQLGIAKEKNGVLIGGITIEQENKLEELGISLQIRTDENGFIFYEIKADDKEEADKIMAQLNDAGFENQFIVGQPDNEKKVEQQVENVAPSGDPDPDTQYQVVLDAEGNEIRIPVGPDVTESDIRKKEEGGEQRYKSWKELEDNIDKLDKSRPFYIGENRYKWNEEEEKVLLVDEKGEYLSNDQQIENEKLLHIFRTPRVIEKGNIVDEGGSPKEKIEREIIAEEKKQELSQEQLRLEEERRKQLEKDYPRVTTSDGDADADNDGIPDTIDIDAGTGTNLPVEGVTPSVVTTEEEGPGLMQKIGTGLGATLKGAGTLLDSIGGPSAIISYIMGKEGLKHAMKEIEPQKMPELSPLFHQHLRQTKELAKKGFHPAEARKIRKEIDAAYEQGLDTAIRGTAGDRAKFLAQSGILDAKRSSALLDFATQDAALQRENQDKYVDTMMFKENFEAQRSEKLRAEDMQMQLMDKQSAAQFTSAAFSNLMAGLGGGNSALIKQMMQMYQSGQTGTTDLFNPANPK